MLAFVAAVALAYPLGGGVALLRHDNATTTTAKVEDNTTRVMTVLAVPMHQNPALRR